MADAVLVNPGGMSLIDDKTLPYGILSISSYAWKEFGIKIIDKRVDSDWKHKLLKELKKNPKVVGLTSLTGPQIKDCIEISKLAKKHSDAKVVWGGIHASLLPEQTLEHPSIDMVLANEAEKSFYSLLKSIDSPQKWKDIPGLFYKKQQKQKPVNGFSIIKPRKKSTFTNLEELPQLPYHLLDVKKYIQKRTSSENRQSINFFISRGCPKHCIYCYNAKFNKSCWRGISAKKAADNIQFLYDKFKIRHLWFTDDNLFFMPERIKQLSSEILSRKLDLTWDSIGGTIDSFDKISSDDLSMFRKAGCRNILFGVESGSQKILDFIGKKITVQQVKDVNRKMKASRIVPNYSFMSGFPTETMDDVRQTVGLLRLLEKENPNINPGTIKPLICYPGTKIFDIAQSLGYKPPQKLEDWANLTWNNYADLQYPWLSKKRKEMLMDLYYYSLLTNKKYVHINSSLFSLGTAFLRPLASYRMSSMNFSLPVESRLMQFIQNKMMY